MQQILKILKVVFEIIEENKRKIDGVKISLLDKDKEIKMRRRLPKVQRCIRVMISIILN